MTNWNETCSFCGGSSDVRAWLAHGPNVAICDVCVENILYERGQMVTAIEAPTVDVSASVSGVVLDQKTEES